MEGIPEARFFPLLGGQSLDRLQVEVVVEVEVAQGFPVNEEVEHVVPLTAYLQADLDPVQLRLFINVAQRLEERNQNKSRGEKI